MGSSLVLGAVFLAGGLACCLVSRLRVLRSLERITQTLHHWREGNLSAALPAVQSARLHSLVKLLTSLNARLERREQEVFNLLNNPKTGMVILDDEGAIRFANPAASRLLNRSAEELKGLILGVPLVGSPDSEIEIYRGPHELGIAEITVTPIEWEEKSAHLVIFHDITEHKRAEENAEIIRYQAYHDELTGLPNRTQFLHRVEEAIHRSHTQGEGFALLFLDLDRFKNINDTLGHAAGDELLQKVGSRLQETLRDNDTVARLSGDEFAILLERIRERDTALKVAEKLRNRLATPLQFEIGPITVTPLASIGISLYPEDGANAEALLMCADTAMYQGKESGGGQSRAFTPERAETVSRRFRLEQALKRAWTNEEFRLFYQPQVALPEGRLIGLEALLRWADPGSGLVPPGDFIPMLEETGMIREVGEWIFRQAASDLRRWEAWGFPVECIWINVAARQLAGQDLIVCLDRLTDEEGLPPERFGIELTESGVAEDLSHSIILLERLRERGFRVALDDFGKGYSALALLYRLPLDCLKIDRSFIQTIPAENTEAGSRLTRAIIELAHGLGLSALAEGVETEAQAEWLSEQGCDFAQGFLFERPLPAEKIAPAVRRFSVHPNDPRLERQ